jgi:glycosyltransferase involved in cell wall biosynthesis
VKTIVIIAYWVSPIQTVGASRINSFVEYFHENGWRVVLIRPDFNSKYIVNHAQFKFDEFPLIPIVTTYTLRGLDIAALIKKVFGISHRVSESLPSKKKSNPIKRLIIKTFHRFTFPDSTFFFWYGINKRKVINIIKQEKPDYVLTSAMPISCHYFGYIIKRYCNVKWIADYRDLYVNNLVDDVLTNQSQKKSAQKKLLKSADLVTTVSNYLCQQIVSQSPDVKKVIPIYNGFVTDTLIISESSCFSSNQALYLGMIYKNQIGALQLFMKIRDNNLFLNSFAISFIGNNLLQDMAVFFNCSEKDLKRHDIHIKPQINSREVKTVYRNSQLLIHFDYDKDGILSSKIFEYLATNIPVVLFTINKNSELSNLVTKAGGIVVDPNYSIEQFELDYNNYQPNMRFINQFSRENQAARLLEAIEQL